MERAESMFRNPNIEWKFELVRLGNNPTILFQEPVLGQLEDPNSRFFIHALILNQSSQTEFSSRVEPLYSSAGYINRSY